jgi:hypothetical protein
LMTGFRRSGKSSKRNARRPRRCESGSGVRENQDILFFTFGKSMGEEN